MYPEINKETNIKIIVLGIGNLLMGDDGIGIHLIREMGKEQLPNYVKLVDGGTAGIDLLYWLEEADHAIIVDCVEAGEEPGAIFRIPADELLLDTPAPIISLHDIGLKEVLLLAKRMNKLPDTVIFGIQPGALCCQTGLSPSLQQILPRLNELVKHEIASYIANVICKR